MSLLNDINHNHDHSLSDISEYKENVDDNDYSVSSDSDNEEERINQQEIKEIISKSNDEIDISVISEEYNDASLTVEGFKCPDDFITLLTPMEFEEIVNLFKLYDANANNAIDKHEARKVLLTLGLDSSLENAEKLLAVVDSNGTGEIDFSQFCRFVVMIKQGDDKLKKYKELLNKLQETPLGELDHQAKLRNLNLKFNVLTDKQGSANTVSVIVIELLISGEWTEMINGEIVNHFAVKRYQGIGKTTREAKYAAATNALIKLSDIMPGIKFKEGDFPDEWLAWIDENLARGIEPSTIATILSSKGFHPYKNLQLMQKIIVWKSFDKYLEIYPDLDIVNTPNFDSNFKQWISEIVRRGIDGEILITVLKDRSYDLLTHQPYITQKILNNELGKLTDADGNEPELLDFFLACEKGYIDEVQLYCSCLQPVNEERLHRITSEPIRPLALATNGGHIEVMKILIKYKADINAIDRRGRNCLHIAAFKGHKQACELLLSEGAIIFQGDHQGNTPLHLAALANHYDTVMYLATKAQDLTRSITSDQIRAKANMTFDDLVSQVYELLPKEKLSQSDTQRFEKRWLSDAANRLISLMDHNIQYMLPKTNEIIQNDVLERFDPRPETGMFISSQTSTAQQFISTIPGPNELAVLLRYMYRLAAVDSLNNFKRTPLHTACDSNHINSHKDLIYLLIDKFGCNLYMNDRHKRKPVDLLMLDKNVVNKPSATQLNEETLYNKRNDKLIEYSNTIHEEELKKTKIRREKVMNECIHRAEVLSSGLWEVVRIGSVMINKYNRYEMYEDPDTKNIFYTLSPDKNNLLSTYSDYSWKIPHDMRVLRDRKQGFTYQRLYRSTLLRRIGNWEMLQDKHTSLEFYYNFVTDTIKYIIPKDINWDVLLKTSTVNKVLGYGNEWEEIIYDNKHTYYHNIITGLCQWDRPEEAIEVSANQRFCTAYQFQNIPVEQKWYSCEQCNRSWSTSELGVKQVLRLCEPCVYRCHKGHKGIRLVRTSLALCNCTNVCKVNYCACVGQTVSQEQIQIMAKSNKQRDESQRHKDIQLIIPPIFAMVPPIDYKGRKKTRCGWMICHRAPLLNLDSLYNRRGNAFDYDTDTGSYVDSNLSFSLSNISSDSDSDFGNIPYHSPNKLSRANSVKKKQSISLTRQTSHSRSKRQLLIRQKSQKYLNNDDLPYKRPIDLPNGWIEVYDPEERQYLPIGSKVLVTFPDDILKIYGIVKKFIKIGFYSVYLIDRKSEEVFERSQLYLLSRKTFYFNMITGQSAWTIDDARLNPFDSIPLSLTGDEWIDCQNKSVIRRIFDNYIEYFNSFIEIVFYVYVQGVEEEQAALLLQRLYRQIHKKPISIEPWLSTAFFVDPPEEVYQSCRLLAGWAYLRRRARNLGDFRDVHGVEWEEYADTTSSEYFYWSEDSNNYSWEKPEVPDRSKKVVELFEVGDEVLYRFPGMTRDELAIVTRIRTDDETGDDMYDVVHKIKPELQLKWIAHIELKRPPLEGDALLLKRYEQIWRRQIKRNHEGLHRKKKREREKQLLYEMERLKEIKILNGVIPNSKGDTASIMRGRVLRVTTEKQEIIDEKELNEGKIRKQLVKVRVEQIKAESTIQLTRADILSLTRAVDTQLQMKDRIEARHKLQLQLKEDNERKQLQRYQLEETLRTIESYMTTPRSLARRQIIRYCHIAMQRQKDKYIICDWGCGEWIKMGYDQLDHTLNRCMRRILPCPQGCDKKLTEEEWLSNYDHTIVYDSDSDSDHEIDENSVNMKRMKLQRTTKVGMQNNSNITANQTNSLTNTSKESIVQKMTYQHYHETEECPKRLVYCPRQCLEWIAFEDLDRHLDIQCTKRPAKPIYCRLGCNKEFGGLVEKLIQSEDDRLVHESEECIYRLVKCNWRYEDGKYCAAQMQAKDRDEHRDYHLSQLGITSYKVPGTYIYKIPSKTTKIKVQAWGAGGGSGHFKHRRGGSGGGGAFVEVIVTVEPYEVLEITVGSGGGAGAVGTEIEIVDLDYQREENKSRMKQQMYLSKEQRLQMNIEVLNNKEIIDSTCGVTPGGQPGGGDGFGGGGLWAAGGGGGYSIISKRTPKGNHALIVAGGGGGGCSLDGLPGVGMDGILPGTKIDLINGHSATCQNPGNAGDSGSILNSKWAALDGSQWQGGHGSEFGAGGGGGYFGGGGGGTTPGLGGGGGGGASYVYLPRANDHVIVMGQGYMPGGLQHDPPDAVGIGDWDKVGGIVGQGGLGNAETTHSGNNGCVRIFKPGHY